LNISEEGKMVLPTENYQVLIPGSGEARKILGVDTGRLRKTHSPDRENVRRWLLSEHRLPI